MIQDTLTPKSIAALVLLCTVSALVIYAPEMGKYAGPPIIPTDGIAAAINNGIEIFIDHFKPLLRLIAGGIDGGVRGLQTILHMIPWLAVVAAVFIAGWRLKSIWLGIGCGVAVLYMALSGHWIKSMNTLAMVGISVPLALGFGFLLGVLGAKSRPAHSVILPTLDLMQTIPTFAYLAPLVVLFGFGPVPGVLASMIYAAPPITRNVMLGLKQVPLDLHEVASMSGATAWQRFRSIELPHAKQQIFIGINQSVLATLSMVIIAAVIGGFDDIGREVLVATNKGSARFGEALGAGVVIVILAVVIDRLTRAAAEQVSPHQSQRFQLWRDGGFIVLALTAGLLSVPFLDGMTMAGAEVVRGAETEINDGLNRFISTYGAGLEQIKNTALIYLLLPMRIGFAQAIMPFTWGFDFLPVAQNIYLGGVMLVSAYFILSRRLGVGFLLLGIGMVMFRGFTFLPWGLVVAVLAWLSYRFAGMRFAVVTVLMLLAITWAGHWQDALYSVYLCTAAVIICLIFGCPLGVWAAKSETVSAILRPINDTLQSIPLYIFLIPAVALFQINEFSAIVAIVLYAVVPLIRYTEHGLRHVPSTLVEAATAQGCSPLQKLLLIELPVARPSILLGLNQTVLFALAMLIIAVLVGARGLAEQVNIGLRDANTGLGLTAGFSMAFIAIIADRILRGWAVSLGTKDSAESMEI
jgi:glycine betaine/proline transport system permease protein